MTHKNERVLSVAELARVEGEGALYIRTSGKTVEEARLDIYEPPRFFEAFLRGRAYFEFPDHACAADMLAMSRPGTYAIEQGTLVTRSGRAFPAAEWDEHVIEEHVPHSTALHAHLAGGGRYLTGPLARYSLSSRWLSPLAREAARAAGLGETCDNPFRSIIVRAVETVYAVQEALRLIAAYTPPDPPAVEVRPRDGVGYGVTEAPRGTLCHRYEIDAAGLITDARIIPPTSQNQAAIEADLRAFTEARLDLDDAELTRQCEQAIRNYDPCISCAAHFLDLTVERSH